MRWWARRGLGTKILVGLLAVLAGLLATTLVAVQIAVSRQTEATLRADLEITSSVFARLLRERQDLLVAGSRLLAADFALKRALATYDPATLTSVAVNYRQRIGADLLWITDDGATLLADSEGVLLPGQSIAAIPGIADALASREPTGALAEVDGELLQLVAVPVLGPDPIGLLILAERIDDSTATALRESTGSEVAFTQGERLLAASWPQPVRSSLARRLPVDPSPPFLMELDGIRYLSLAVAVTGEGPRRVTALLQRSYDAALQPLVALRRRILWIGAAAFALACVIAGFFARGINAPIRALVAGMREVVAGNLAHRVDETRADELGFLARSFNGMSESLAARERALQELNAQLEARVRERTRDLEASYRDLNAAQSQLAQAEKMASLGVLVAGVAHEINNPVTLVVNSVDPLRDLLSELGAAASGHPDLGLEARLAQVSEAVDLIAEGAERTAHIVDDLRTFSRQSEAHSDQVDIHGGIEVTLRLLRPRWAGRVAIHRDFGAIPPVMGSAGQLNQVWMNLLANACDAIAGRGNIHIATRLDGDAVRVSVADDGAGIAPADLGRVFEPFFTTKPQGKGTGLGLALSHAIVESHGGSIRITSEPGRGTEFAVTLPLRPPASGLA